MLGVRKKKEKEIQIRRIIYSHTLSQLTLLMDRMHVVTDGGVLAL